VKNSFRSVALVAAQVGGLTGGIPRQRMHTLSVSPEESEEHSGSFISSHANMAGSSL